MRLRLVCFDGDDTLWDFDRSMRNRLERVLEVLWSERMDEATAQLSVDGLIETRERVAEELEGRVVDLKAVRLAAFERSLEDLGTPDPALAEWMAEVYFEDPTFELFDDVVPVLRQLAAERLISVVTNGDVDPGTIGLDEWVSHTVNALASEWPSRMCGSSRLPSLRQGSVPTKPSTSVTHRGSTSPVPPPPDWGPC